MSLENIKSDSASGRVVTPPPFKGAGLSTNVNPPSAKPPIMSGKSAVKVAAAPEFSHTNGYKLRRFANWFPLGLTYATFYMGRYNFNVVKGDMGKLFHLDKVQMGWIATAGFWTYALSVIFNGPLADRFGGRKAILLGAIGSSVLNLIIGALFLGGWQTKIVVGMSLLYSCNMYFQSFGALSVVKVNSAWFHVKERGIFGGIFGTMISGGYFLAMQVGAWILAAFGWQYVFIVPAFAMMTMFAVDYVLVKDRPSHAGHPDFNTGDASAGDETPADLAYLVKRVLKNPVIITIAAAEFCTGFVRQGLLLYFVEFLREVHKVGFASKEFAIASAGITVGGICGGILCGWMSDKLFQSRRAPVAVIFYVGQVLALLALGYAKSPMLAAVMVGVCCMWIFGVHGMLSGTASMDFGGRKAAATVAGMLDGVQYIASGFTGFGLGYVLKTYGWDGLEAVGHVPTDAHVWVFAIIPFSILGGLIMTRLWNATPKSHAAAH